MRRQARPGRPPAGRRRPPAGSDSDPSSWSGSRPATTRLSIVADASTSGDSCRPSTSSRRSSTTRTRSVASPRRTRSPTSTRWAASRSPRSTSRLPAELPTEMLGEILRGGARDGRRGRHPCGGHSVDDAELKFGLAVTGVVHPDRIWPTGRAPGRRPRAHEAVGTGRFTTAAIKGEDSDGTRRRRRHYSTLREPRARAGRSPVRRARLHRRDGLLPDSGTCSACTRRPASAPRFWSDRVPGAAGGSRGDRQGDHAGGSAVTRALRARDHLGTARSTRPTRSSSRIRRPPA